MTILAAAIVGVIFINFMGTAMSQERPRGLETVEAEANAQALMEQIVAEFAIRDQQGRPVAAR